MSRKVNWDDPTEDDLRWAIEWERKRDLEMAGYDFDEVQRSFAEQDSGQADATEEVQAEPVDEDDYSAWTVEELRAELKNRQLPADGKKDALVARLEEDDQNVPAEE